jgi:hypothetical protein
MALDGPMTDRLAQAGGRVASRKPWFVQQVIELAAITVPEIEGYQFRHVERGEAAVRAACHHAGWSDSAPSGMSARMYETGHRRWSHSRRSRGGPRAWCHHRHRPPAR